jgi:acetate kinase
METPDARHALQVYSYRIATMIGAMTVAAGGIDALVFTGGVGEGSSRTRSSVAHYLSHLGVELDAERNASPPPDGVVSVHGGVVRVVVIPSREDLILASDARAAIGKP